MLPTRLYLRNYIPIGMSDIKEIDISFDKLIQLVLGGNGSGKSTLLQVCAPIAPDGKDFEDDGEWHFWMEHANSSYEFVGRFGKKSEYEFIKDGVALLENGTASSFNRLIEEHIGYSPKIHELLTSGIGFTSMVPSKREELLMLVSRSNFTYVNNLYIKAKQSVTEAKGIIQLLHKKHNDALVKLETINLDVDIDTLISEVRNDVTMYTELSNQSVNPIAIKNEITFFENKANDSIKRFDRFKVKFKEYRKLNPELTLEQATKNVNSLTTTINFIRDKVKEKLKELSYYNNIISRLAESEKLGDDPMGEINRLKALVVPVEIPYGYSTDSANKILDFYKVFSSTDVYSFYKPFTKEQIRDVVTYQEARKHSLDKYASELDEVRKQLDHIELSMKGVVVCPSCHTEFIPNLSNPEQARTFLLNRARTMQENVTRLEKEIAANASEYNDVKSLLEVTSTIRQVAVSNPLIGNFLRTLGTTTYIATNHLTVAQNIHDFYEQHIAYKEYTEAKSLYEESLQLFKMKEELLGDTQDTSVIKRRIETLEEAIEEGYATIDGTTELLRKDQPMLNFKKESEAFNTEALHLREKLNDLYSAYAVANRQSEANNMLMHKQQQLAMLLEATNLHKQYQDTITTLATDIELWTNKYEARKKLVTSLSPKLGIIGDTLKTLVTGFLSRLNEIIEMVWEYPLEVIYVTSGRGELKFTANVKGKTLPGFHKLSTGQRDVINFATTLLVMERLGLKDFPLYLDEIGSTFDYVHRRKLVSFLTTLTDTNHCSMLFLIQHFASDYGGIPNANTLVIDATNVQVTGEVNSHVSIMYA